MNETSQIHPANLTPSEPTPDDRQRLLDAFAAEPQSDAVWNTAYGWVRAEGDAGSQGVASGIPTEELIDMAETVRSTDPTERYNLMTGTASNGALWFDVIEGFSSDSPRHALTSTLATAVDQRQSTFTKALDLGTGTGKSLAVLEQAAEEVVGVDRNPAVLIVAKQRARDNIRLVQAEVTNLPFEDASFDLISSLGIEGALDKPSQVAFYTELGRVLQPDGIYFSAFCSYPNFPNEEMAQITQTSKAMLADMICDSVSGGAAITERLDTTETEDLFASLGLQRQYYLDVSGGEQNQIIIQMISKKH